MISNIFYSGWRPTLAWIGTIGVAIQFVAIPLFKIHGMNVQCMEIAPLTGLIVSLLGLGSLRTYEKLNGIAAGSVNH